MAKNNELSPRLQKIFHLQTGIAAMHFIFLVGSKGGSNERTQFNSHKKCHIA